MADEERYNELRRKFHPVLIEMDRRRVRLQQLELRNGLLYLRGEAGTPEDRNYVWDEIRAIDPDLVTIDAEISVGQGAGPNDPKAADRDIERTTVPEPNRVRAQGDRGWPTGTS